MSALAALALLAAAETGAGIPWIHDDWATAKKQAVDEGKLVAVDVWATWCHTCLSMKNFTLEEAPLGRVATTHTWLALDYDRPDNAEFFTKFPINAFPTFLVVDPKDETVVARWLGSGTAEQMAAFFAGARKSSNDAVAKGQRAIAAERYDEALGLFEAALAKKPAKPERMRLLAGYSEALWKSGNPAECAKKGAAHLDDTEDTAPGIDYAALIADCASSAPDPIKKDVTAKVKARLERAAANPALSISPDDLSGLYGTLGSLSKDLGDVQGAKIALEKRVAILEAAAAKAETPEDRATFDAHRLDCYLELGRLDEAEKMLRASAAAMPRDFNPPARLARLYMEKGDHAKGLTAIDQALALGYGPRKVRLYSTKIDLLIAAKKLDEARKTAEQAKAEIGKMNPKLVRKAWIASLESQLTKIGEMASTGVGPRNP